MIAPRFNRERNDLQDEQLEKDLADVASSPLSSTARHLRVRRPLQQSHRYPSRRRQPRRKWRRPPQPEPAADDIEEEEAKDDAEGNGDDDGQVGKDDGEEEGEIRR